MAATQPGRLKTSTVAQRQPSRLSLAYHVDDSVGDSVYCRFHEYKLEYSGGPSG